MNRKNLLFILLALMLVGIGNWLVEQGVRQVDKHLTPTSATQQDYYLSDFTIRTLDEQGGVQQQIEATRLSHYADAGKTLLEQPKLQIFKQNSLEWRITAQSGELSQEHDEVLLEGKISMVQPTGKPPLKLTTSHLRIRPKLGVSETQSPVTLIQGKNRIDAVGMRIEQKEQQLTLLSRVRGRYEALAR